MIFSLFSRRREPVFQRLYGEIVSQARLPVFYRRYRVPDTVEGRFEMILIHLIVLFKRCEGESRETLAEAQKVLDHFFMELDKSIREMGVGDVTVPKKMRKLGEAYAGRAAAYGPALAAGDAGQLVQALARNVYHGIDDNSAAAPLATYVFCAYDALKAVPAGDILANRIPWPVPANPDAGEGVSQS